MSNIVKIKKERLSNFELLRIIAMFLVLVVHADFFALGAPNKEDVITEPLSSFGRYFFESISIICVNLFVLISGWFGIKFTYKGISNFIFQCLFFLISIYLVCLLTGISELSIKGIAGCFALLRWNWFIKAYLCLYIIAPILNSYIEKVSRKEFWNLIIIFFLFQTIYGWAFKAAEFFVNGYSTISFIGLYLLARYTNIHKPKYSLFKAKYDILIFGIISVILTLIPFIQIYIGKTIFPFDVFSYINPLVIISALYFLLYFSKQKIKSKIINKIAISCFAVFLLHTNPNLCTQYFVPSVKYLYEIYSGITFLAITFGYLIAIFVVAILIDQIRLHIWNKYISPIFVERVIYLLINLFKHLFAKESPLLKREGFILSIIISTASNPIFGYNTQNNERYLGTDTLCSITGLALNPSS